MGRVVVLGSAVIALFAGVAATLAVMLFGDGTLWSSAPITMGPFVGITVVGTVREWRRSRRSRR